MQSETVHSGAAGNEIPFRELLEPIALTAVEALPSLPGWTDASRAGAGEALLDRLAWLAAPTLLAAFETVRPPLDPLTRHLVWKGPPPAPREAYGRFVAGHRAEGLGPLLDEYPVLRRLLPATVELWRGAVLELAERLERDRAALAALCGGSRPPGALARLRCAGSDSHHGGRTVWLLELENGARAVYKPRPVAMEAAWSGLLEWCNAHGLEHPLRAPWVLERDGYGWMELVEHAPCADAAAVTRFYTRAGSLLALVHLVSGTDCHDENLLAAGEHPVLVDCETLFAPRPRLLEQEEHDRIATDPRFRHSVLGTGFLPRWEWHPMYGMAREVGALGSAALRPPTLRAEALEAVNTDWMRVERRERPLPAAANAPLLEGSTASPLDHLDGIAGGFRAAWERVVEGRDELLAPGGALDRFRGLPVRFVFRPTYVYLAVLREAIAPEGMRDDARFRSALEGLLRPVLRLGERPPFWPLLQAEQAEVERLDVPYFAGRTDSADLPLPAGVVGGYFAEPSYQAVRDRIRSLTRADLEFDLALVRGSLVAAAAVTGPPAPDPPGAGAAPRDRDLPPPLERAEALAAATAVGDALRREALLDADACAYWLGLTTLERAGRFQFGPLLEGMHDGISGIALFLAALDRTMGGGSAYGELAGAGYRTVSRHLHRAGGVPSAWMARRLGPGGISGVGSLVFSLTAGSRLLEDPALLEAAAAAARLLTAELVAADRELDVFGGVAGAALGLLELYDATGDAEVLARAVTCGEHLLERRTGEHGARAWLTISPRPLSGFSHGAAGIACSLLRLDAAAPGHGFAAAGREAIAYERTLFDPTAGNWRDLREPGPSFRLAWCHGAPGIGLGRLRTLALHDTTEIRREIEIAVATTAASPIPALDTLCCGAAGQGELLLAAGRALRRPELEEVARRRAAAILARARLAGGFALLPASLPAPPAPGLLQGNAGVALHLLRLFEPHLPDPLRLASSE